MSATQNQQPVLEGILLPCRMRSVSCKLVTTYSNFTRLIVQVQMHTGIQIVHQQQWHARTISETLKHHFASVPPCDTAGSSPVHCTTSNCFSYVLCYCCVTVDTIAVPKHACLRWYVLCICPCARTSCKPPGQQGKPLHNEQ